MYTLYGDGVHDDYPAIQEMIDSGVCEVSLPVPENVILFPAPCFCRLVFGCFSRVLRRYALPMGQIVLWCIIKLSPAQENDFFRVPVRIGDYSIILRLV